MVNMVLEWVMGHFDLCVGVMALSAIFVLVLAEHICCRTHRFLPVAGVTAIMAVLLMV